MSFREPLALIGLALVPLAILAYWRAQRRRRRYAVRYTAVGVLAGVAGRSWGRHIPALLALLAIAALAIAMARPQRTVAAEQDEAIVVMVTDTSGSMKATDVRPDRLTAAQEAGRAFIAKVPDSFRIGLVTFGSRAEQQAPPTTDHQTVRAALAGLKVAGGTAMGDGLKLGLSAARTPFPNGLGGVRRLPAAIVLLSDGAQTHGTSDPVQIAAQAGRFKVPIYTVALGTSAGRLTTSNGGQVSVPPDTVTLREIAKDSKGQYFNAPNAARLEAVYRNLGTRLAVVHEKREVTGAFAGGALLLLVAGGVVSLLRTGRLP
jgi:Ca-activated chloride channel family protein